MRLNSIFRNTHSERLFLGAPEAEAEVLTNSRISLVDVYEDYQGIISQLEGEKFIVVGRKGCGKSAVAEYLSAISKAQPNLHCDFVRATDFGIEVAIQGQPSDGGEIGSQGLFRWLIYTRILKMFVQNEAIKEGKDYTLLNQFLQKNSGYIDIRDYEIKELIQKNGFDVSVEQFKRFMKAKFNREVQTKSERAPYYKLLPHLEEVIQSALTTGFESENSNQYLLFFDDLDVWFSGSSKSVADSLIGLVRACRHINNEVFAKKSIQAKAVILMRDDIEAHLSGRYADSAKIFATYSTRISWLQDENEERLNLKKFINKRIKFAFEKARMPMILPDPWACLVAGGAERYAGSRQISSFRHVLNQTLYRPRDLLLFFKPLESNDYTYPLSERDINDLSNIYFDQLVKEVKNELASFYSGDEVELIFQILARIAKELPLYPNALEIIKEVAPSIAEVKLLDYLFDRSVVGIYDQGKYWFKHREQEGYAHELSLNQAKGVGVHYGIRAYTNRVYRH